MVKARGKVRGVGLSGPLAPFRDIFEADLRARGYTPQSVVPQLRQACRLSRWLQERVTLPRLVGGCISN